MARAKGRKEMKDREMKKLAADQRLVKNATRLGGGAVVLDDEDYRGESDAEIVEDGGSASKKRNIVNHGSRFEGEADRFNALMKESEQGMMDLDRDRLELEVKRHKDEIKERAADRKEL